MNIEEQNLMYIVALPEVFEEYHVYPVEFTRLQSGKIFVHASKCGRMILDCRFDTRVDFHTEGTMPGYTEYVDGYFGEVEI